jgi:hypothetical protein
MAAVQCFSAENSLHLASWDNGSLFMPIYGHLAVVMLRPSESIMGGLQLRRVNLVMARSMTRLFTLIRARADGHGGTCMRYGVS